MSALRAFTMPKWGIEMQEGTVAEWLVPEGQSFTKGQLLALIETDKITNEVEAERDGTLKRIVTPAGETKPVGALLAVIADGDAGDAEVEAFAASFRAADTSTAVGRGAGGPAVAEAEPAKVPLTTPAAPRPHVPDDVPISPAGRRLAEEQGVDVATIHGSGRGGRITHQDVEQAMRPARPVGGGAPVSVAVEADEINGAFASPLAKRLAAKHGINLKGIEGTGPRGRISKADVLARIAPEVETRPEPAAPKALPAGAVEVLPMSNIRKVIARRLTEAKQTIPHFYLRAEVSVDELLKLRPTANKILGVKASVNDYLIKAAALALVEVPDVNIQVHGTDIHRFADADISVAVASEKGLVTPVVRAANRLRIDAISATVKALVAKAKAGRLTAEDMEGGSFSLSNLGMYGVDQFDAIINPPQGAILAVGVTQRVWAEQEDGSGRFETRMGLSLSCDHRAIDGATGAQFLAALKRLIEAPERLFGE